VKNTTANRQELAKSRWPENPGLQSGKVNSPLVIGGRKNRQAAGWFRKTTAETTKGEIGGVFDGVTPFCERMRL
jgi:hypothetical protein